MTNGTPSLFSPEEVEPDLKMREIWRTLDAKTKQAFKSFSLIAKLKFLGAWLSDPLIGPAEEMDEVAVALLAEWKTFKATYPNCISAEFKSARTMMQSMIFGEIKLLATSDEKNDRLDHYECLINFAHPMSPPSIGAIRQLNRLLSAERDEQPAELLLANDFEPALLFAHGQMSFQPVVFEPQGSEFNLEDAHVFEAPKSPLRHIG